MRKSYLFLGVVISLFAKSELQGQTSIDAEFRPRTEVRAGFRKPLADTLNPAIVTLQRTRLNADYKGKVLNARISLQDARVWGSSDTKTNASKVEINEAWAEYLITSGFSAQMGRQALNYDDKRLFSSPNWSNTGTSHDILVLKYKGPFMQVHAGAAYNNAKDTLLDIAYSYTAKQNYKTLNYVWASKEVYPGATLSLIGVCDNFQNPKDYRILYPRYTYGGNLFYASDSSALGFTLTGYMQQGKTPNKTYRLWKNKTAFADLNAFFLAAKVSYKVSDLLSPYAGFDYYSGTAYKSDSTKSNSFERLYGAPHAFNGYMEYFQTLPTQGLVDYYAGVSSKITPKLSTDLTVHSFYFDKDFYYKNVKTPKNIGTELDFTVNYTVSKEIAFQGGYSYYFGSGATKSYYKMLNVNTQANQWAYVMFTFKPQLYKTPPVTLPESK